MRRLPILIVALVLAGCGAAAERTNVPASSGEETVSMVTGEMGIDESKGKPPPIILVAGGGKQEAVPGSSCVSFTNDLTGEGVAMCADTGPIRPEEISVVHPGDWADIVLAGAYVDGEGTATVRPLGCADEETRVVDLADSSSETHWRVDMPPGVYQIDVFARFASNDGRSGDVSGTVGLFVGGADDDVAGAGRIEDRMAVCPFPG